MAHFRDNKAFDRHQHSRTDAGSRPFYYRLDSETYLAVTTRAEEIPRHWKDYRRYRYDFIISFVRYLNENGVDAKVAPLPGDMAFLLHTEMPVN